MGSKNRGLYDKLAKQSGPFKLGEVFPQAVKDQLGVDSNAPKGKAPALASLTAGHVARVQSVIEQGDPRMLAAHLLSGDIAVSEIPARFYTQVLSCVQAHHTAVSERNNETIRQQREALGAANQAARERDESRVVSEGDAVRQRRTAHDMGRQVGELHRELEQARLTIAELQEAVRASHSEASELRADLAAAKEEQLGATEGAIFRSFLDLVNVQVAQWLTERETLFGKAEFLCSRLEEKAGLANDLLSDVRADVQDAEAAKVDRTFDGNEATWMLYLEKVAELRKHMSEYAAVLLEVSRFTQQRAECTDAYEALDRKGKELRFTIFSVVRTFDLIGVDVWARAQVSPDSLESMEPSARVIKLMMQAIPAEELSLDWTERVDALQSHILTPQPKRVGKKEPAQKPLQVQFFPGRIFMVEPEREVERLVGILLMELHASGITTALFPNEIALALMRSGLTNLAQGPMTREVTEACQALIGRGIISRHPRRIEGIDAMGKAFASRDVFTQQYARAQLAQVEGGHGKVLCEKLRRVIPAKEH